MDAENSSLPPQTAYGSKPRYAELIAIIVLGGLHVATELAVSLAAARVFNAVATIAVLAYVVWRASRTKNVFQVWGVRLDNFLSALRDQLIFALPAAVLLIACGIRFRFFPPPNTFWVAFLLYPVWGMAQQFVLQNFVVRNLKNLISSRCLRSLLAALLFGLVHVPRIPIVAMAVIAAFFLTMIYERRPNIWAVGCVHGMLGALVFYFVLGDDPGERILEFWGRLSHAASFG